MKSHDFPFVCWGFQKLSHHQDTIANKKQPKDFASSQKCQNVTLYNVGSEAMHVGALWKMENGSNENTNGSYESTKKRRMAQKAADGRRDKAAADE